MEENLLDEEIIQLEGFVTFYKFENEANGYRIASFKIDDNKQERTIIIITSSRISDVDKIILEYKDKHDFKGIYPISALEGKNIEYELLKNNKEFKDEWYNLYEQVFNHSEYSLEKLIHGMKY